MKKAGFLLILITLLVVGCSKGGEIVGNDPSGSGSNTGDVTSGNNTSGSGSGSNTGGVTGGNNTSGNASHLAKVLIHDFTGTWCGYCADAIFEVKELHEKYPDNVISVAVHTGSGPNNDGSFDYAKYSVFGTEGNPILWFNNKDTDDVPLENLTSTAITAKKDIGLAINYDLTNNKVKVKVRYDKVSTANKLVVYMVEDKLYANQVNYSNGNAGSPAYQKGDPIPNLEHNNVLRETLTATLGNVIPDNAISNNLYTADYVITSDERGKFSDISNSKIIAFVINKDGKALNAQVAKANENKGFD